MWLASTARVATNLTKRAVCGRVEFHGLQNRIIGDVGEFAGCDLRPILAVGADMKFVVANHAAPRAILSRQVGEAGQFRSFQPRSITMFCGGAFSPSGPCVCHSVCGSPSMAREASPLPGVSFVAETIFHLVFAMPAPSPRTSRCISGCKYRPKVASVGQTGACKRKRSFGGFDRRCQAHQFLVADAGALRDFAPDARFFDVNVKLVEALAERDEFANSITSNFAAVWAK